MVSLNDLVHSWGIPRGYSSYDEAKRALIGSRTQHEVSVYGGASSFNEGLYRLADVPSVLVEDSVLWLDAQFSKVGEPRVVNQGLGGSALNAKYGSVLGAYIAGGEVVIPGTVGNHLSTPDTNALDVAGDIEIVVRLKLVNWASGASQNILNKWTTTGNQRSFTFFVLGAGGLGIASSVDGVAVTKNLQSTAVVPHGAGQYGWVKAVLDVDNGAGGTTATFFTAPDQESEPSSWTQLGSTVTSAGTTTIFNSTTELRVGVEASSVSYPNGSVKRAIVRNGIDGPAVFDMDLTNVPDYATSFTAVTGQTVTVNSTSSDTNDPLFLPHTGENYVYFPGSTSNRLIDTAALARTLDSSFEVRLDCIRPVSPASNSRLFQHGIYVDFLTNNSISATFAASDATFPGVAVTAANVDAVLTPGGRIQLRLVWDNVSDTLTLNGRNYSGQNLLGDDGWTVLGSAVHAGKQVDASGARFITIGNGDSSTFYEGKFYSSALYYDSVLVHHLTPASISTGQETSIVDSVGRTFTVGRTTSGRKTALVTRPVWLFGTDDFLEVADNDLLDFGASDSFTVMAVLRNWATTNRGQIVYKRSVAALSTGWGLFNWDDGNDYVRISDGVTGVQALAARPSVGSLRAAFGVRDKTVGDLALTQNTTEGTPVADATGGLSNGTALGIGATRDGSATFMEAELVAVAVWRRALTADEIAEINTYYGTV